MMKQKILEATRNRLFLLQQQYSNRVMPATVIQEIARLQALVTRLEARDSEEKS